jgi:hypothetical protein
MDAHRNARVMPAVARRNAPMFRLLWLAIVLLPWLAATQAPAQKRLEPRGHLSLSHAGR